MGHRAAAIRGAHRCSLRQARRPLRQGKDYKIHSFWRRLHQRQRPIWPLESTFWFWSVPGEPSDPGVAARGLKTYWGPWPGAKGGATGSPSPPDTPDTALRNPHTAPPGGWRYAPPPCHCRPLGVHVALVWVCASLGQGGAHQGVSAYVVHKVLRAGRRNATRREERGHGQPGAARSPL